MRVLISWRLLFLAALLLSWRTALGQGTPTGAGRQGPPTPAQRERWKERTRLAEEADEHILAGRVDRAIAVLGKKAAVERELFGKAHLEVVKTLLALAKLQEYAERFAAA